MLVHSVSAVYFDLKEETVKICLLIVSQLAVKLSLIAHLCKEHADLHL